VHKGLEAAGVKDGVMYNMISLCSDQMQVQIIEVTSFKIADTKEEKKNHTKNNDTLFCF